MLISIVIYIHIYYILHILLYPSVRILPYMLAHPSEMVVTTQSVYPKLRRKVLRTVLIMFVFGGDQVVVAPALQNVHQS